MDTPRAKKRFILKGSVLYTVTLVMMVMLILMMSAIALAGTANKRAYAEYHDDQTTYTGRSIVDSVVKSLAKDGDNEALGEYIVKKLGSKVGETVVVNVNDAKDGSKTLQDGFGTVEKLEFTYAGKDEEGGFYITGAGYKVIKITATVKMGNETTTYSQYVCGSDTGGGSFGGGAGFLAASGSELGASTGASFHGPSYTGTLPERDESGIFKMVSGKYVWPDAYKQPLTDFRNNGYLSGGGLYGSTLRFSTDDAMVSFSRNNHGDNGITALGNMAVKNPTCFLSEFKPDGNDPVTGSPYSITDIPYIYCDGTFYMAVTPYIGSLPAGKSDTREGNPINIYAGRVLFSTNPGEMYSSIYCYNTDGIGYIRPQMKPGEALSGQRTTALTFTVPTNPDEEVTALNTELDGRSTVSVIAGNGDSTKLLDWASASVGNKLLHTGSIYTKGNLKLGTSGLEFVQIKGDVSVEQVLDMTNCKAIEKSGVFSPAIDGDIYVNGQLMVSSVDMLIKCIGTTSTNKVICRSITDGAGNDLSAAAQATGRVTIKDDAFTWPSGMEKDDILGKKVKDDKIINTQEDAFDLFYDVKNNKFKRSINQSMADINGDSTMYLGYNNQILQSTVLGEPSKDEYGNYISPATSVDITTGCTIAGSFQNCTFNITPPKGTELWINLYDVKFDNCKIIVDDSEGREVYFFIPQGENYSPTAVKKNLEDAYFKHISDYVTYKPSRSVSTLENSFSAGNTNIITKNYYDNYFDFAGNPGQTFSLKQDLDLKSYYKEDDDKQDKNEVGENLVPDVYICAADNVGGDVTKATNDDVTMQFTNQCCFTGHIIALNSHFSWAESSLKHNSTSTFTYTLEGSTLSDPLSSENISIIGSVFTSKVMNATNNYECFYVDYLPEAAKEKEEKDKFAWNKLDGFVTY